METNSLKDYEIGEHPAVLERVLATDYRLSFKFSQGSAKLQEILFALLGTEYRRRHGQKYLDTVLTIDNWADLSMPPAAHTREDAAHIERESVAESEKFRYYMDHPDLNYIIEDVEIYRHLVTGAIELTLLRDLKYIEDYFQFINNDTTTNDDYPEPHPKIGGRPHRPHPIRYVSFFKKYVIDERPTGSDAFNAIFQDMRTQSLSHPSPRIKDLALAWESHHHGRSFYAEDFMSATSEAFPYSSQS